MKKSYIVVVIVLILVIVVSILFINTQNKEKIENNGPKELLYEITYTGIDCLTPRVVLYSDNTYEYYNNYSVDGNVEYNTGTYDYDLNKIIESANNSEELLSYYTINDSKNSTRYIVEQDNVELNEFLNTINARLNTCIEYNN